jgi:hypothetical protein
MSRSLAMRTKTTPQTPSHNERNPSDSDAQSTNQRTS